MINLLPPAKKVFVNPDFKMLRMLTEAMPNAKMTAFHNFNIQTRVTARSAKSTFIVSDVEVRQPRIGSQEYSRWAEIQDAYIKNQSMIRIDGNIATESALQTPCCLYIEAANANIAAMQKQLFFPLLGEGYPKFNIIYTPNLPAEGFPDQRLILVNLDTFTTRIFGSDYFGESKKGALRMWNKCAYDNGGLALHAGCKIFPEVNEVEKLMLIVGLSGTGKTTTTFRQQFNSLPVQDDFCALLPKGKVISSENGCFAKTFGLDPAEEPSIYNALARDSAWLENVAMRADGSVDYYDGTYTTNGRGTFPLEDIPHRSPKNLPPVSAIVFLNRNLNIIPAVAKLNLNQAAAYFMLGESTGTSAGGAAEEGKFLRIPGTNPFFPMDDSLQGNRFLDLIRSSPDLQIYLMNTGRIGGGEQNADSIKVKIRDSSAILSGIIANSINWTSDADFGYELALQVPGIDDPRLLNPKLLYTQQNRLAEYVSLIEHIKSQRNQYLNHFVNLYPEITNSLH